MRQCVTYILDPDTTLTFDLKVKFIGFWLFFMFNPYLLFDTGISYLAHGSISMIPIRHWPFDLHVKFIGVLTWLCVRATQLSCLLTKSYHIWYISVSSWYDASHTFRTSAWPWPLASISKLYFHYECVCFWFSLFTYMEMSTLPVRDCNYKFWPMLGTHGHWAVRVL